MSLGLDAVMMESTWYSQSFNIHHISIAGNVKAGGRWQELSSLVSSELHLQHSSLTVPTIINDRRARREDEWQLANCVRIFNNEL